MELPNNSTPFMPLQGPVDVDRLVFKNPLMNRTTPSKVVTPEIS
jgi:hypothetical protein